jgi:ABC-type Co2+ transport system permease subunit
MHIPDGFLSPQTYLPAAALAVALLDKAQAQAAEVTQAMRARGAFD